MKVQYASDLHLEFCDNARYLRDNPMIPTGEILLLAGDIGYLNDDNYSLHPFWDWASENFRQTLVIPGNHEFYKSEDVGRLLSGRIASIRPNVNCYYNAVVTIDDVDFILSTLWAHIRIENAFVTELHDLIYDHNINYWIYGHSHRNMPEIDINGTKMLCNQFGYVHHGENTSFNPCAYFEI